MNKLQILRELRKFVNTRPNFKNINYSNVSSHRADRALAEKQKKVSIVLINYIETSDMTCAHMIERLSNPRASLKLDGVRKITYEAGAYYPTEFRKSVCNLCFDAIQRELRISENEFRQTFPRFVFNYYYLNN
jgi:hypothetical protein